MERDHLILNRTDYYLHMKKVGAKTDFLSRAPGDDIRSVSEDFTPAQDPLSLCLASGRENEKIKPGTSKNESIELRSQNKQCVGS